jgi:hypothetical protein
MASSPKLRWRIVLIGLTALAACSHWAKPGVADERQYRLDVYACTRDAGLVGVVLGIPQSDEIFAQCMTASGYARTSG